MCGRADVVEALLDVPTADVVLHLPLDHAALGVEDDQAGADLVGEAEEVQLRAEPPVVAALGLGQLLQVGLVGVLALPRGAVDALQLRVLLAAPPVGGGAPGEGERGDRAGARQVRAAAEVGPDPVAGAGVEVVVHGQLRAADLDGGALGVVGAALEADQLQLVRLVRELGLRVGVADLAAGEVLPGADDLLHLLLERREVLGGEGPLGVEVVVEAVLDRRADAELGAGEELLHRLGQHVRGRVPDHRAAVGAGGGHRLHLGVGVGRPVQVLQVTGRDVPDDDRAVGALERDPGVLERLHRRRPGRDPDRGNGGRRGRGGHRNSRKVGGLGRSEATETSARPRSSRDDGQPRGDGAPPVEHAGDAVVGLRVGRPHRHLVRRRARSAAARPPRG